MTISILIIISIPSLLKEAINGINNAEIVVLKTEIL